MAKFYYNGVLLPEILANVLAEYPYAFIYKESTKYHTIFSKTAYWYQSSDDTLRNSEGDVLNYWITYDEVDSGLDWYFRNDSWYYWGTATSCVLWSNYDILQVTDSKPSLWFAATEPVPEFPYEMYEIKKTTLANIADKIKSKIGNTEPIKVSNFANTIESIAPKLQSKVATENGNYIPDEGYDGLKYVSVNVPEKEINLQNKVIRTNGIHSADSGYDGFGEITVVIEGVDTNSIFATMTNNVELTAFVPQYTSYINEVIMEVN